MTNLKKLFAKFPSVICAVQFGSSISGDTYNGSDIDLLVIIKNKKDTFDERLKEELNGKYQIHLHTKNDFLASVRKREPLSLSIVHTGKALKNGAFIEALKNYKPTMNTAKKCMLNSFAALGLGVSDLIQGMTYDAVNSIYHAARSSIWATLMPEITPNNKRVLELLKDKKMRTKFKRIIAFRQNIPDNDIDRDCIWDGTRNAFTDLLDKSSSIIKQNYSALFRKNFVDVFTLLQQIKKNHKKPAFYSILLSVDWDKQLPFYHVMLSYDKKWISMTINANTGKIMERQIKTRKISGPD